MNGGINLYAYAENDPINLIDPTGLWAFGDPLPQGVVDAATGFGDGAFSVITFGFGDLGDIRDAMGIDGGVNECSAAYGAGSLAGNVVGGGALGGAAGRLLNLKVNAFSQGNVFKITSGASRAGFRVDRALTASPGGIPTFGDGKHD